MTVRTRFAPSPTGYLHIGGVRTALYNWLFARHGGGEFLLRIEDTDKERSTPEATEVILDGMKWLGLDWDGEIVHQSGRLELYRKAAEQLLEAGLARRDSLGHQDKGEAVVFNVQPRDVAYTDLVKGTILKPADSLDKHIVIIRSNGFPTYNFACVVDDSDMGITHVIRGDDHVANTWKQLLLYEALGKEPPEFAHLPMIHNDRGQKLSKRDGAVAVTDYRKRGFLPEALVNFLALLGWSPGDDREIMSVDEMVSLFDLNRVRHSASRFDLKKLEWMNGRHIAEGDAQRLASLVKPMMKEAGMGTKEPAWYVKLVETDRERARTLRDFVNRSAYLISSDEDLEYDAKAVRKFLEKEGARELLVRLRERLGVLGEFTAEGVEGVVRELAAEMQFKLGKVAQPLRVAVTGGTVSPPIGDTVELLGRKSTLARLDRAIKPAAGEVGEE